MLWSQPEQLMRKKLEPTRADEAEVWPHVLRSQASPPQRDWDGHIWSWGHKDERVCKRVWSSEGGVIRTSSRSHPGFIHFTCWKPHLLFFFFLLSLWNCCRCLFFWWQPSFLSLQMCVCGTAFLKMLLNYSALVWGGILMSSLCRMQPFGCRCSCVCVFVCVNILFIPYQIGEPWYYTLSLYKYSSVYTHK